MPMALQWALHRLGALISCLRSPSSRVVVLRTRPRQAEHSRQRLRYARLSAPNLREPLERITRKEPGTLVCRDAPLTGTSGRVRTTNFTERPIERFRAIEATRLKTPNRISLCSAKVPVRIGRSVGPCSAFPGSGRSIRRNPNSLLPHDRDRHQRPPPARRRRDPPALAAWLWQKRARDASRQ